MRTFGFNSVSLRSAARFGSNSALALALVLSGVLSVGCDDDDAGNGSSAGGGGSSQTGGASGRGGSLTGGASALGGASTADGASGAGGASEEFDVEGDRRIPFTPPNDRAFVDFFIEHHQMAVNMAELEVAHGSRADVKGLAQAMITAQTREIGVMQAAESELADPALPAAPADPHADADMTSMIAISGSDLDQMFLMDMITHHAAGLPVAHRSLAILERADLRDLASNMSKAQATEIGEMHAILVNMGVTSAGEDMAHGASGRPDFGLVGDRRIPLTPADDIEFIDFFAPHHTMAIAMAEAEIARGASAEILAMAQMMRDSQSEELATMRSIRAAAAGDPDSPALPQDPLMMAEMRHMMSLSGTALDKMFLTEMIPHHAAGIPTAHRAKPHVQNADLRAVSDAIYQAQAEEVGRMQRLLDTLE